jgi:fatty-acid desaturase
MKDDMKDFRIEQLKRVIPELESIREKKSGRRLLIVFIGVYIITTIIFLKINEGNTTNIWLLLFVSLLFSCLLMFVTYIINSLTFGKNQHEAMIIEKLKTELYVLSDTPESPGDMLQEISKIRNSF